LVISVLYGAAMEHVVRAYHIVYRGIGKVCVDPLMTDRVVLVSWLYDVPRLKKDVTLSVFDRKGCKRNRPSPRGNV